MQAVSRSRRPIAAHTYSFKFQLQLYVCMHAYMCIYDIYTDMEARTHTCLRSMQMVASRAFFAFECLTVSFRCYLGDRLQ